MSVVIRDGIVKISVDSSAIPNVDFSTFFTEVCDKYKDRTALVDYRTGAQYTYGELFNASRSVAAGLKEIGLSIGDVVALHCRNRTELLVALCGVFFVGGCGFLVKTEITEGLCLLLHHREMQRQFKDIRPVFVISDEERIPKVRKACLPIPSVKRIIVTIGTSDGVLSLSGLMSSTASKAQNISVGPDSVLAIICSSGSSGLPKGVQLTHRNVIAQMISMRYHEASIFQDSDVGLCSASITHVGGFWFCFGFLGNGCKVVLVDTSDFTTILSAIEKHRATSIVLYPMLLLKLNQHLLIDKLDTSSLTKLMVAGGTVTGHLLESVAKKLKLKGIIQVYGMTELSGAVTLSVPQMKDTKSVGKPAAFMEMKIVDVDTRPPLGPLEQGEICIRGPSAFKGYLGRPQETAANYEDSFVITGDTGYYTSDGLFYICGRIKELIKCMDQQVAPAELEELLAADAGVRHVVVAGVPHPQYGEAARAFVVPSQPLQTPCEEQQEASRLVELVAASLARHKHLHGGVECLERIPQTESGKELRNALKNAYIKQQSTDQTNLI